MPRQLLPAWLYSMVYPARAVSFTVERARPAGRYQRTCLSTTVTSIEKSDTNQIRPSKGRPVVEDGDPANQRHGGCSH